MTDKPHTPTTEEVRELYAVDEWGVSHDEYRAEFYRWLDGICMNYEQRGYSTGIDHAAETNETEIAAAEQRGAAPLLKLLQELVDPDDCWFDHNGGCQAHGYLWLEPDETCPHQDAKELIRADQYRKESDENE